MKSNLTPSASASPVKAASVEIGSSRRVDKSDSDSDVVGRMFALPDPVGSKGVWR